MLFYSFVVAMIASMSSIPLLMRWSVSRKLMDQPGERKVHKKPIPEVGGIAMFLGAIIPIVTWLALDAQVFAFLMGIGVIFVFGVWDDYKDLNYRIKFLGQLIAAIIVVVFADVRIHYLPFLGLEPVSVYIAAPLAIFALLGITNAINLADGLDGLAGGTTLLSLSAIAVLAYQVDAMQISVIAVTIMGCLIGFLRFNTFPARVFMGDAGSQFLGFSLGVLCIWLTQRVHTALSPVFPVVLLGLPIFDTLFVMANRLRQGRSPFSPDRNHIHHKLLAIGFDHHTAVALIYVAQAVLVTTAYLTRYQSDATILGFYLGFCAFVGLFVTWMPRYGRKKPAVNGIKEPSLMRRWMEWTVDSGRLGQVINACLVLMILAYVFPPLVFGDGVPRDIGIMASALLSVLACLYFRWHGNPLSMYEHLGLYLAISIFIYYVNSIPGGFIGTGTTELLFFVLMAILVVVGLRVSQAQEFQLTTLDILVLFIALVVPNLPGTGLNGQVLGMALAKMCIFFYAMELVLANTPKRSDHVRMLTLGMLSTLTVRQLFL
jgi:UDP-GlcNAc:undecaprenyl-phosphate GlcNAc-1-phosphate transferase